MAGRREIDGGVVMGWPDRRRLTIADGFSYGTDEQGRVIHGYTPVMDLEGLLTPAEARFIVMQLGGPDPIHPDDWSLSIYGEVERPYRLSFEELRDLPGRTVRVVTECAGNDSHFWDSVKQGKDVPPRHIAHPERGEWLAVSGGEFTGVPLAAVLEKVGLNPNAVAVRVEGFDRGLPREHTWDGETEAPPEAEINFDKCLPMEKALDPDTLVAWSLNGDYLRHVHGAPVRLVVPGWAGNWSVKWLHKLEVLDHMVPCYYQTRYFVYADSAADPHKESITALGVKSMITDPRDGDPPLPARFPCHPRAGLERVRGYRAGGGKCRWRRDLA